jgi:hypothetical protein
MNPKHASLTKCRTIIALLAFVVMAASSLMVSSPVSADKKNKSKKITAQGGKKTKMDTPTIGCASSTEETITLSITAGASGAPAGFSVQWITCEALAEGPDGIAGTLDDNTWPASDSGALCKASFSGNANGTQWNLGQGGSIQVVIGGLNDADPGVSFTCEEPLECDTCYVFRAFAHATSSLQRSDFTANQQCSTSPCLPPEGHLDFCTKSQGYYGGNGQAGLDQLIACFGGFNGAYDKDNIQTQQPNPGVVGANLLTLGGGTNTYEWHLTGIYPDIQGGPGQYLVDSGLLALRAAIGGQGGGGPFSTNGSNTNTMGTGAGLASQTGALTLNISLSGNGCSGFPGGLGDVVLCHFVAGSTWQNNATPITQAQADFLNGQTVSQVLAAVNAYLGNGGSVPYGLNVSQLNELVAALNLSFHETVLDEGGNVISACGPSAFASAHLCAAQ